MASNKVRQNFELHKNHPVGTPHNIEECGICHARTIINEGLKALIEDAYGPQHV